MQAHNNQKNLYVVLAAARGDADVLARGLNALGITLGNRLVGNRINSQTFFEDEEIVRRINEPLFTKLNSTWDAVNVPTLFEQTSDRLIKLKTLARHLLSKRLSRADHWGFKDPRTAKLIFFWQDVFQALPANIHYIIALSHPLTSVKCCQQMDDVDLYHDVLLWLTHFISAVQATKDKHTVVVSKDCLLQAPKAQLIRLKDKLHLINVKEKAIDHYINQFVDKNMQHDKHDLDEVAHQGILEAFPLCMQIYELLFAVATDQLTLTDPHFDEAWTKIMYEYKKIEPFYHYMNTLIQNGNQLARKIRKLHKSHLWRIISPLRYVDDLLRSRRQKRKLQRQTVQYVQ